MGQVTYRITKSQEGDGDGKLTYWFHLTNGEQSGMLVIETKLPLILGLLKQAEEETRQGGFSLKSK